MRLSLSMLSTLAITLLMAHGCRSAELLAPEASELLPVSVQTRTAPPGEPIPAIHVSAGAGSVIIRVTRVALCATLVNAAVSRGTGEVDVVSRVSNNPIALCGPVQARHVVDYTGTVSSLAAGTYRIRVFEGLADGTPRFIGSAVVTVLPPEA